MRRVHNAVVVYEDARSAREPTKVLLVQDLRLPIHMCLGHLEAATQEELSDLHHDILHELSRRDTGDA